MTDIALKCACGQVEGTAHDVTANGGTRAVCYCDDCQAFAGYLKNEDVILDEHGGTDIFQMTPAQIIFSKGSDQLRCVRLRNKGLYRWYSGCCNTPIGNTIGAGFAFIGVIHNIMDDDGQRDQNLGPVRCYAQGNYAKEGLPPERFNKGFPLSISFRVLCKLLLWRLQGKHKPSPFYEENGQAVSKPVILEKS